MADWAGIKSEYLTTRISQRALAEKYGIAWPTLRDRAAKEGWARERSNMGEEVSRLTLQKTAEKIADTESEIAAIKARMRLKWWQRQERALDSLLDEEGADGRNSADARREMQNYVNLLEADPVDDMTETEDADAYFGEAGLNEDK